MHEVAALGAVGHQQQGGSHDDAGRHEHTVVLPRAPAEPDHAEHHRDRGERQLQRVDGTDQRRDRQPEGHGEEAGRAHPGADAGEAPLIGRADPDVVQQPTQAVAQVRTEDRLQQHVRELAGLGGATGGGGDAHHREALGVGKDLAESDRVEVDEQHVPRLVEQAVEQVGVAGDADLGPGERPPHELDEVRCDVDEEHPDAAASRLLLPR